MLRTGGYLQQSRKYWCQIVRSLHPYLLYLVRVSHLLLALSPSSVARFGRPGARSRAPGHPLAWIIVVRPQTRLPGRSVVENKILHWKIKSYIMVRSAPIRDDLMFFSELQST